MTSTAYMMPPSRETYYEIVDVAYKYKSMGKYKHTEIDRNYVR